MFLKRQKKKSRFLLRWLSNFSACVNLLQAKEERSMKQNGSLCSVIVGNLVAVSLTTQTWFLSEDVSDGAVRPQP